MTRSPRRPYPGRLPRLPREHYQGDAFVHWTLSIQDRATGWLTEGFHARFRECMLHAAAREGLFCPAYCLMPDHLHVVWMGLRRDSDQRNGMAFVRTYLEPALSITVGDALTSQSNPTPVGDDVRSRSPEHSSPRALQVGSVGDALTRRALQDEPRTPHPIRFQPQAHDSVLRQPEREHGAFAKVCFYILNNPVKADLVSHPQKWMFNGCVVPGYPTLHPLADGFWETFWKLYEHARHPDAGDIRKPMF